MTSLPSDLQNRPSIAFDAVGLIIQKQTIYQNLNFEVKSGEFVCLLGPSGCGKSTALRLIGGLLHPTSGNVRIDGSAPDAQWQSTAYVFQNPRLVPWRNALRNVTLARELRFGRRERKAALVEASSLLELVGLGADGKKFPHMLSGGERQRVSIARALSVEPNILLMDEPFSALDPNTRTYLRRELVRIWQQTGKTIIFVTHDVEEAVTLADRVIVMSNKPTRIIAEQRISLERPRSESDEEFIKMSRLLRAKYGTVERWEERT